MWPSPDQAERTRGLRSASTYLPATKPAGGARAPRGASARAPPAASRDRLGSSNRKPRPPSPAARNPNTVSRVSRLKSCNLLQSCNATIEIASKNAAEGTTDDGDHDRRSPSGETGNHPQSPGLRDRHGRPGDHLLGGRRLDGAAD